MKFIEVTDRFGDIVLINFDLVEKIYEVKDLGETYTYIGFEENFLYIQEPYTQIKSRLAGV